MQSSCFPAYLDDISLFSSTQRALDSIVHRIRASYKIRVTDCIESLLGISIVEEDEKILMHNEPMIEEVLKFFKKEDCNSVSTPLPAIPVLHAECFETNDLTEQFSYRQMAGSLMHLANTHSASGH